MSNTKHILLQRGSTVFLRAVIIGAGLIILALCIFALPVGLRSDATGAYKPIILGMYGAAIPFFLALKATLKLLGYIDTNKAFSVRSLATLRTIKRCAVAVASIFALGSPYIYHVADMDDAPGVLAFALLIIGTSIVIAVFSSVLQKLLASALAIKTENDLTV